MTTSTKTTGARICSLLLALLFFGAGILFLMYPIRSEAFVGLIYICFFTATGIMQIITYFTQRKAGASGWSLALGILDVLLGIYFLGHVYAAIALLPYLLAFWAICSGFMRIIIALQLKGESTAWGWGLFFGGLLMLVGILMLFNFGITLLTVAFLLAFAMFICGFQNLMNVFA